MRITTRHANTPKTQTLMEQIVTNNTQIKSQCEKLVTELIACRKQSQTTQESMADWLGVSRKKLNAFKNAKNQEIKTMHAAVNMRIQMEIKFLHSLRIKLELL